MFTGLIESTGTLIRRNSSGGAGKLAVKFKRPFADPVIGESIAVNGCCLTLEQADRDGTMHFHTLEETLRRTNLGALPIGSVVNGERALCAGARLGGHMVSGHVDAACKVISMAQQGADVELKIAMPPELAPFMVEKGSVAVDGVSLTLVAVTDSFFTVHLIPVTLGETALALRSPGMTVNIETDIIGKYVVRQMSLAGRSGASGVSMDTLREAGFL